MSVVIYHSCCHILLLTTATPVNSPHTHSYTYNHNYRTYSFSLSKSDVDDANPVPASTADANPAPVSAADGIHDIDSDLPYPRVSNKHDLFCLIIILIDQLVCRKDSTQSFLVTLLAIYATLPLDLKHICPRSWYQTKAFLKANSPVQMIEIQHFDVCPADCLLFRKNYADVRECPSCNSAR